MHFMVVELVPDAGRGQRTSAPEHATRATIVRPRDQFAGPIVRPICLFNDRLPEKGPTIFVHNSPKTAWPN